MTKNVKMDGGAGVSVKPPQSSTMKFYRQVQESCGYDDKGHPMNTGRQANKLAGNKGSSDPTKGLPKYQGNAKANKGPNQVVSKRKAGKVHKLAKGMSKGKGKVN